MIINESQTTIKSLSNDYNIDSQKLRRFIKKEHMDKISVGANNAWLIGDDLREIVLDHFHLSDRQNDLHDLQNDKQDHHNDLQNDTLIIELNNRIKDKDSEISYLRKALDNAQRLLENEQTLNLKLHEQLDNLQNLMLPEPDAETIEPEMVEPDEPDIIAYRNADDEIEDEKPLFSRVFRNMRKKLNLNL